MHLCRPFLWKADTEHLVSLVAVGPFELRALLEERLHRVRLAASNGREQNEVYSVKEIA